jgi:5-methylcytosine-specific restriction endonuclease McrA
MTKIKGKIGPEKAIDTYSAQTLSRLIKANTVVLNPDYQTGLRWSKNQKSALIDSLILDYDLPKIYFRKKGEVLECVDGQQRLSTIRDFMDDTFKLGTGEYKGKVMSKLPVDVQRRIWDFELHVITLEGDKWTDEVTKDLFLRLQMGTALNPAEKRRALPGAFPSVVARLADHVVFKHNAFIKDNRFAHEDAVAKALHLVLKGESAGISEAAVRDTYLKYQDISMDSSSVKGLKRALDLIAKAFKSKGKHFKKFSILSVVPSLYHLLECYNFKGKEEALYECLRDIERRRDENDELPLDDNRRNAELTKLTAASRSDRTDDLKWRKDFYTKTITDHVKPVELDPCRTFTYEQRLTILEKQGWVCKSCKCNLSPSDAETDHHYPHARGGKTKLENAQVLCRSCNAKKGAKVV